EVSVALYLVDEVMAGQKVTADVLNPELGIVEKDDYTPDIDASGGTVAVGADGFLTGKYWRIGTYVWGSVDLNVEGSGASIDGTSWRISLPFAADLNFHTSGVLNAASDIIGNFQSRSGGAGEHQTGAAVLSGP